MRGFLTAQHLSFRLMALCGLQVAGKVHRILRCSLLLQSHCRRHARWIKVGSSVNIREKFITIATFAFISSDLSSPRETPATPFRKNKLVLTKYKHNNLSLAGSKTFRIVGEYFRSCKKILLRAAVALERKTLLCSKLVAVN